jgi:hypothetical protein
MPVHKKRSQRHNVTLGTGALVARARTYDGAEHKRGCAALFEQKSGKRDTDTHAWPTAHDVSGWSAGSLSGASCAAPCGPSGCPCFSKFARAVSSVSACRQRRDVQHLVTCVARWRGQLSPCMPAR